MDYLNCPFCKRIAENDFLHRNSNEHAVAFGPLKPVAPGHLLVVSRNHIEHAAMSPYVTSRVMEWAAVVAARVESGSCNIITSIGEAATQTVKHLHVHVVPRIEGDGLALPWTTAEP